MKIGLVSLGCPKNLVDSEVMLGLAEQAGHQITADAAEADVIVVNTCAFIDSAKQESIDAILEMAQHKTGGRASDSSSPAASPSATATNSGARSPRSTRCSAPARSLDIVGAIEPPSPRASAGHAPAVVAMQRGRWRCSHAALTARRDLDA